MSKQPEFKTGDIVYVNLGKINSKEIKGHEQGKIRPCVIIKSLHLIGLIIIVPFTSKKPKNPHFFYVKIEKDGKSFIYDSYALCHQIRTVSIDRVSQKKGILSTQDLDKIRFVLSDLLEL